MGYEEKVLHSEGGQLLEQASWGSGYGTKMVRDQGISAWLSW